jgi:hypothetical protein
MYCHILDNTHYSIELSYLPIRHLASRSASRRVYCSSATETLAAIAMIKALAADWLEGREIDFRDISHYLTTSISTGKSKLKGNVKNHRLVQS